MRNDKLSVQSMDFAVSIIHLVKELKIKKETIISNQIGRSAPPSVQTFEKHNMLTAEPISCQNSKLL